VKAAPDGYTLLVVERGPLASRLSFRASVSAALRRLRTAPQPRRGRVSRRPGPSRPRPSFDHLVGAQQERFRYLETEDLCGGQIKDKIELGRLLDWQGRRFSAL
jgi:hypothetical protein